MTDRELLELAAKAAGYKVRWHEHWNCHVHVEPNNIDNPPTPAGRRQIWVPLHDDGDALRLAVKLNIGVQSLDGLGYSLALFERIEQHGRFEESHGKINPEAATRRAIVRAAAEIGRARK